MLNPRQEQFCLEYSKCGNATAAYKLAGFKSQSRQAAQANSARLLADERIQARLKELAKKIESDKVADTKEIQERLTKILRGDVTSTIVTKQGEIINVPVSTKDKLKAAELLAKTHGAFISKAEIECSTITPVVIVGQDKILD